MFAAEHVEFELRSAERTNQRVGYCPHILKGLLKKFRLDEPPSVLLQVVTGLVLVERIRDATHPKSNHPIYQALSKYLVAFPKNFTIEDDWLTTLVLGDLISTPEYQLVAINFRLVPLYFETLDIYYNISNSRYIVDSYTEDLGSDVRFLRLLIVYLERYGLAAKNRFEHEAPHLEVMFK